MVPELPHEEESKAPSISTSTGVSISILVLILGFTIWLVRLSDRTEQNTKDIAELKRRHCHSHHLLEETRDE